MGAAEKIFIILCTIATFRAHTHGIRLIIILALAYLLQSNNKKGNKKPPKSLFRRSTDSLMISSDENPISHPTSLILQRALELDQYECVQRAICRLGMRQVNGFKGHEDRSLFRSIFGNKTPGSKGEEVFQAAAIYGQKAGRNEKACHQRYNKCPHSETFVDSLLAGIG